MGKLTVAGIVAALSKEMAAGEVNLSEFQKRTGASDDGMKRALQSLGLSDAPSSFRSSAPKPLPQDSKPGLQPSKQTILASKPGPSASSRLAPVPSRPSGNIVSTPLDIMYERIQAGDMLAREFALELGAPEALIESWAALLERQGIAKLVYPINFMASPFIAKARSVQSTPASPLPPGISPLDSYGVKADNVPMQVRIFDVESQVQHLYHLTMPVLGPATEACLDGLVGDLAEHISIETEDLSDPKKVDELKEIFFNASKQHLINAFPSLDPAGGDVLAGIILHKAFGLGKLELVMADDYLEEVVINGSGVPIAVYHRKHGWLQSNVFVSSEDETYNYASQIGRKIGRQITTLEPIMDAHLLSGDRVNATLFPISSNGNTITIRKFARNPWTIVNFIDPNHNTISPDMAATLWLCMQYEMNVMVAGGTASGKTSILNALCALIPPTQRILTIEDTRELSFPAYLSWNWIPLTTRNANPEGKGEVGMLDLMVSALRMRPDRVVLGEMRKKREAEVLFEAMHTGHSVYATMHAETVAQVYRRLTEPPMEIPSSELEALHIVITQFRDRRTGKRRTYELAELLPAGYREKTVFNILYRWSPRTDTFSAENKSSRVFEELNIHTGMTEREITQDIQSKKSVFDWMLANDLSNVDQVGETMRFYYKHTDALLDAISRNKKPSQVF